MSDEVLVDLTKTVDAFERDWAMDAPVIAIKDRCAEDVARPSEEPVRKFVYYGDYISDDTFFITITLSPKLHSYGTTTQYDLTIHDVKKALGTSIKYILVTEVTKTGQVHYHAIVVSHSTVYFVRTINLLKKCRKLGFINVTKNPINTEENFTRAHNYLRKDLKMTEDIIHTSLYKPYLIFYS